MTGGQIVVAGGTGFIGSALVGDLVASGHDVRVQYVTGQWLDIDDALDLARAGELV